MAEIEFIKGRTKKNIVVFSVLLGVAAIVVIILSLMIPNCQALVPFIGGLTMCIVGCFVYAAAQIRVFKDYKSRMKYLCADGILCICLGALSVICIIIFLFLGKNTNVDFRIIIAVLIFAYCIWKIVMCYFAVVEKKNNWYLEIILTLGWILYGVCCLLFAIFDKDPQFIKNASGTTNVILWIMAIAGFLITAAQIIYLLYSYIFKVPTFLECEEAFVIAEKEEHERQIRMGRLATMSATPGKRGVVAPAEPNAPVEEDVSETKKKLQKLKKLFDEGLITEEDYKEQKTEILKNDL